MRCLPHEPESTPHEPESTPHEPVLPPHEAAFARGPGPESVDPESVDPDDPDAVEDLGDAIATLAAHLHAATHRFLVLIARFDRVRGWEPGGHRTCAHWLACRTGLDLGTAREHVRVARSLENLPQISAAMARGALSFSQIRALTRVAKPGTESDLLELATGCTTAQLERMVRSWRRGSRADEAEWERERHRSRALSVFPGDDGMVVVKGRLDPEVGAVLMRAIEAASDALYRSQPFAERGGRGVGYEAEREAARRRADAIGLLAERALAAGFGSRSGGEDPIEAGSETVPGPESDGAPRAASPRPRAPLSGTRAARYQVLLHVDLDTLAHDGEPGCSELEDGARVSAETSRRLSCDAALVPVTHAPADDGPAGADLAGPRPDRGRRGPDRPVSIGARLGSPARGRVLDVGRSTRTIPPALRRALEVRDRGCRFPGCGLRFTEAHHVTHWADGGETNLDNTLLLCRFHHRLVHEGGWRIEWWGVGRPAFRDPRGQAHVDGRSRPPPRLPARPVSVLCRLNRLRGADPDAWTASVRWEREADIPDAVLFRAIEAGL